MPPPPFLTNDNNRVGTGPRRVLVDAGEASARAEALATTLREVFRSEGVTGLDEIVITHLHHDHVGGAMRLAREFGPCKISKLPSPQSEIDARREVVREAREKEGIADDQIPKSAQLTWFVLRCPF